MPRRERTAMTPAQMPAYRVQDSVSFRVFSFGNSLKRSQHTKLDPRFNRGSKLDPRLSLHTKRHTKLDPRLKIARVESRVTIVRVESGVTIARVESGVTIVRVESGVTIAFQDQVHGVEPKI
jgi:hypothetical protein